MNSLAGRRRLPLDLRHAAEKVEGDPADRQAVSLGQHAVRQLVQQHRHVQQHREGERDGVGGGRDVSSGSLARTVAPNSQVMKAATMNQVHET